MFSVSFWFCSGKAREGSREARLGKDQESNDRHHEFRMYVCHGTGVKSGVYAVADDSR